MSGTYRKEQPVFDLSRDFRERAEQADRMSYRRLHLKLTCHADGFPHLLETGRHRLYDRVETGLDDLVVTRAIFENPDLAVYFLPYLDHDQAVLPAGDGLDALKKRARSISNLLSAPAATREEELKYWITRSDAELDLVLDYLKEMKPHFTVDFAGRHDTDNIARLETLPETRFLPGLKQYFARWMYATDEDDMGQDSSPSSSSSSSSLSSGSAMTAFSRQAKTPLDTVVIALETLVEKEDELRKARFFVDDTINQGRRVVVPQWAGQLSLR